MSDEFKQIPQDALRLPPDEQARLREALEDVEGNPSGSAVPPRIAGLNRDDPRVLHDLEAPLTTEYLGEPP